MWALASAHVGTKSVRLARIAILLLAVFAGLLCSCKGSAVPGLTTPDFALSTPAPLPGPGEAYPPGGGSSPPGVPDRAKKRFVRLTRRSGGVMPTVTVPIDYQAQPGDTIYVLERLF